VKIGGSGKLKRALPHSPGGRLRTVSEMLELQGFPLDLLDDAPFTMSAKRQIVANGVPLPMGRAIAKAVRQALETR
jgi:site-specific DNA-cytosine methylase